MVKFIQEQALGTPAALDRWTVAVVEGANPEGAFDPVSLGGRDWSPVIRARLPGDPEKADIKNVMNKGDRGSISGARLGSSIS